MVVGMTVDADDALDAVWHALGGGPRPTGVRWAGPAGVLPSRLPTAVLARATVAAYALAAEELATARGLAGGADVVVDSGAVGTAFTSERHLRRGGRPFDSFASLSRFWRAADGWVRTHGNYPHHQARLLAALAVPDTAADLADAVGRRIAELPAATVEDMVTRSAGLAVAVRTPDEWTTHPQGAAVSALPLLSLDRVEGGPPRSMAPAPDAPRLPAHGVRVLDLTRVIAGPVATRSLALLGADVLRVDSRGLPELEAQHLDTGFGKRSTLLDLAQRADRAAFEELLSAADVVVTGYRPGALDRFGLGPPSLLERRPGLVVASLSAWGPAGPWSDRRGFDSLVQAATGIAMREAAADGSPGALPAQALDHGTGYLLAAAVLRGMASRIRAGGGWSARLSLAQTARWLLHDLPATASGGQPPGPTASTVGEPSDPAAWCVEIDAPGGRLRHALPAVTLRGGPRTWAHPPTPWGSDAPRWR
jgi:crotonobetainyl-CoA:carnitine CoA-transferase CaiB-like acyl-CoA transferase